MGKPIKIALIFVMLGTLLSGCGGEAEKDATTETESDLPFEEDQEAHSCLIIGHRVKDFSTWKASFDLAEAVREKYGIRTRMVMQGYSDPNVAMVFTEVNDVNRAKEYVTSQNLKNSMEMAGVESKMDLYWLQSHLKASQPSERECIVYMSFRVRDYDKWKTAFLEDYRQEPQKDFDVLYVFQSIENPNEVSMIFAADNPDFVKAMESNNNFRMKMLASGVVSYPKTHLLRKKPV